jgi:hypothetical protein
MRTLTNRHKAILDCAPIGSQATCVYVPSLYPTWQPDLYLWGQWAVGVINRDHFQFISLIDCEYLVQFRDMVQDYLLQASYEYNQMIV